jgi:formylglycine-generating enzyme required for sulfatase activity
MSKYELTNAQFVEFLNAVAAADPHGLYNTNMGLEIARTGAAGGYNYSLVPPVVLASGRTYDAAKKPVRYVSVRSAMRFANWLENGQPTGPQSPATTEDGAYTLTGRNEASDHVPRNAGARFAVPSADEFYKAAFYDPALNAGQGGYWDYPTRSNAAPTNNDPLLDDGNSANFSPSPGASGTGDFLRPATDVGAYANTTSAYGIYDLAGNAMEITETPSGSPSYHVSYGGFWSLGPDHIKAETAWAVPPAVQGNLPGLRLVMVPEPGSLSVLVVVGACATGRGAARRARAKRA